MFVQYIEVCSLKTIHFFYFKQMTPQVDKRTQINENIHVEFCKMKKLCTPHKQKDFTKWQENT